MQEVLIERTEGMVPPKGASMDGTRGMDDSRMGGIGAMVFLVILLNLVSLIIGVRTLVGRGTDIVVVMEDLAVRRTIKDIDMLVPKKDMRDMVRCRLKDNGISLYLHISLMAGVTGVHLNTTTTTLGTSVTVTTTIIIIDTIPDLTTTLLNHWIISLPLLHQPRNRVGDILLPDSERLNRTNQGRSTPDHTFNENTKKLPLAKHTLESL